MKQRIATLALAMLTACSAAVEVNHDYDPKANFVSLVTYSWLAIPEAAQKEMPPGMQQLREEIAAAIERALTDEGYQKTDSDVIDFYVNFHASAEDKIDLDGVSAVYGYGYGGYPWGYYGNTITYVQKHREGTLLIDVVDRSGKKLMWRGTGEARVQPGDRTLDERRKGLDQAVRAILANFPPKPPEP